MLHFLAFHASMHLYFFLGKRDPGIPNRFPFKEEILKEVERRKQQVRIVCCVIV